MPYLGTPQPHWASASSTWDTILPEPDGWELFNRHVITNEHRRWVEFFFGEQLVEPHSTKQLEDAIAWSLESTGEILAASEEAQELELPDRAAFEEQCRSISVPTLVVHGDRDVCQHVDKGRAFAELVSGELVVLEGAGHLALVRDPVPVNLAITNFIDRRINPTPRRHVWTRAASRRRRVLYLSSPIGLGHVRRDLAIADELRRLSPDLEIDWLAQDPVTAALLAAGETIHPASDWLSSESAHIASESCGHDLHCFQALRSMDEILVANFMLFQEVVEEGLYDLVVGDEAWDVDHFWHENPELKRGSHVWLTDFVGFLPMPDGSDHEAFLTNDYNAEMIDHIAAYPRIRDRSIFVGNPNDVVADTFGPGLPKIRDWTESHFDFSGYITGFSPPSPDEIAVWRAELGYRDDELVCVITVGGSGVGRDLLELAIAAHPIARRSVPELRTIAVAGPRIDPRSLPSYAGLDVRRLRRPPLPTPRRVRPGDRAGRADDDNGAHRGQATVPVLPARPPLRAELPRAPPARPVRGRCAHELRDDQPGGSRRRDSPPHRPPGDLPRRRDRRRATSRRDDRRADLRTSARGRASGS